MFVLTQSICLSNYLLENFTGLFLGKKQRRKSVDGWIERLVGGWIDGWIDRIPMRAWPETDTISRKWPNTDTRELN